MDYLIKLFLCLYAVLFTSLLFAKVNGVEGSDKNHRLYGFRPTKLFVFGDSYADTGNIKKSLSSSWKFPYGITFPGKPAGRFSDGRVATDFLAKFVGIKSPIPYLWKNYAGKKRLQYGMNFAYGGTGVFNTQAPLPNMTTQIDFFHNILTAGDIYTPSNLISSVALVSVAGNDYYTFLSQNRPASDFPAFMKQVVDQIEVNLRRIHALGVKKVAVPLLQPLGCLPSITFASSFQRCNETQNALVRLHNTLLQQAVAKLNKETKQSSFIILDLYNAFLTVFSNKGANPGSTTFQSPLKPCCDFPAFMKQVVDQIEVNMRRIHALGVKKVAVTLLQPLGCLPSITFTSSFQRCNETQNALVRLHNSLLQQAVAKLNNETKQPSFIILDLYNAFLTVFNNKGANPGSTTFQSPLKPCCVGVSSEYNCGSVDEKGVKKYMICDDPKSAFFWDGSHPTEEGWRSVYSVLHESLTESFMKA